MSNSNTKKMNISYVDVDDLKTDYSYQRALDEKRVKKIAQEFMPELTGAIVVSRRRDGSLYIIDGNHRVAAMRAIGKKYATANILDGLSSTEEAELFRKLNTSQKKPRFNEILFASIAAGNEEAVAYKELLDTAGVSYSFACNSCHDNSFIAHMQGLNAVRRYGGQTFIASLRLLDKTLNRLDGMLVAGVSLVLHAYPHINRIRLMQVLSITPYEDVVRTSASFSIGTIVGGNNKQVPIAKAIVSFYNKGLHAKARLDLSVLDKREVRREA